MVANGASQYTGAFSVDNADGRYTGDICFVEELVNPWQSLIDGETVQIQFRLGGF